MPRCKLDDCPVAKDGRCLEGRGTACPNLILDPDASQSTAEPPKTVEASEPIPTTFESLPGRAPLDTSEARTFAQRGTCMVVALAGMPECGKTSLLARLHQMFQAGSVAEFDFAGSRSLPLFEEMNWRATIESCEPEIKMTRSSSQTDNSFLHLAVRSSGDGARVELLLNDIAGDTFEKAVAAQSICEKLVALARADHLVVLVDGAALAAPTLRYYQVEQVRDFLQRVLQGGRCGVQTALHIVISKLDKLRGHEAVADEMETNFRGLLRATVGSLNFWRIAARPTDGSLPTQERIGELFAFWARTTHRCPAPILSAVPRHAWARDFCRYGI
jgi:Double-GTPase 2